MAFLVEPGVFVPGHRDGGRKQIATILIFCDQNTKIHYFF